MILNVLRDNRKAVVNVDESHIEYIITFTVVNHITW